MEVLSADTCLVAEHAATVGFFDGVHLGHRYLLQQLQVLARMNGLDPLVVTFDCHPRQVLQQGWRPRLLTSLEEKVGLLRQTGDVRVMVVPFDLQMSQLPARDFMHDVLLRQLGVRLLLTGYDNHFGHRTADSTEGLGDYMVYGRAMGIDVVCASALSSVPVPECKVSSSLVRRLLGDGRIADANACLGRCYRLEGTVVHGEQVGRQMGFPTANMQLADADRLVPMNGVYAVRAVIGQGAASLPAMTNIGMRPTFDGQRQTIETHLFGFSADVYGAQMSISFVERLRDERHFDSPADLAAQMALDAEAAQKILRNNG